MKTKPMAIRRTMCAVCPFRAGSPLEYLMPTIAMCADQDASRICHLTGSSPLHFRTTGRPATAALCRGARDFQLRYFTAIGVLTEATDKAWAQHVAMFGGFT